MITDYEKPTKYYEFFNANPTGKKVGDCSIRAVVVALNTKWKVAFSLLATEAMSQYCCMDEPQAVGNVLKQHGFTEMKVSVRGGNKRPTLKSLIKQYPNHIIVGQIANHFAAARGGKVRDLWNSSERTLYKYWIKEE